MFKHTLAPGLDLRLLENQHCEELFALVDANRQPLKQWLPWVDGNKSVDDTKKFCQAELERYARNSGFSAGVFFEERIAGVIGFHAFDWNHRKTSLGYWLGTWAQGRGFMTMATRALVNHALRELKLNRVEIRCGVGNHKSSAIPRRLGFRLEGVCREVEWLYDHFVDLEVYGMLAEEWK